MQIKLKHSTKNQFDLDAELLFDQVKYVMAKQDFLNDALANAHRTMSDMLGLNPWKQKSRTRCNVG